MSALPPKADKPQVCPLRVNRVLTRRDKQSPFRHLVGEQLDRVRYADDEWPLVVCRLAATVDVSMSCSACIGLATAHTIATFDMLPEQQARHTPRQFPDAFGQGNCQRSRRTRHSCPRERRVLPAP